MNNTNRDKSRADTIFAVANIRSRNREEEERSTEKKRKISRRHRLQSMI